MGKKYGTSYLNCHIGRCKKRKSEDVSQMILDMQGKLKAKKVDKMVAHKLLCNLMIMRNLPFIFVKYLEFRALISYLCPEMIPISRNTSNPDMLRIYDMEKTIIKELLCAIPGSIELLIYGHLLILRIS